MIGVQKKNQFILKYPEERCKLSRIAMTRWNTTWIVSQRDSWIWFFGTRSCDWYTMQTYHFASNTVKNVHISQDYNDQIKHNIVENFRKNNGLFLEWYTYSFILSRYTYSENNVHVWCWKWRENSQPVWMLSPANECYYLLWVCSV